MKIRIIFFFWSLVVAHTLFGNNEQPIIPGAVSNITAEVGDCNVLPPDNLHALTIGTNFVDLDWVPNGPPPAVWRVQTFLQSNHQLLRTDYTTGHQLSITNLPEDTDLVVEVNGQCADGKNSEKVASFPFHTLIVDLILQSFTPNTFEVCTLSTAGICTFNETELTTFKIYDEGGFHYIFVKKLDGGPNGANPHYKIYVGESGPSYYFNFECAQNLGNSVPAACQGSGALAKRGSKPSVVFTIAKDPNSGTTSKLVVTAIMPGTIVAKCESNSIIPDGDEAGTRSNQNTLADTQKLLSIAPNPFVNFLNIHAPFARENEPVQIALYDLQGRRISQQDTFGSADAAYTMATESLAPGMYFLAVEAAGARQMVKLVKTE